MPLRSKEYLYDIPASDGWRINKRNGNAYLVNKETEEIYNLGEVVVEKSLDDRKTPLRPAQFNWAIDGLKEWGIAEHFVEIQSNETVCNNCYIIINKYRECDCK